MDTAFRTSDPIQLLSSTGCKTALCRCAARILYDRTISTGKRSPPLPPDTMLLNIRWLCCASDFVLREPHQGTETWKPTVYFRRGCLTSTSCASARSPRWRAWCSPSPATTISSSTGERWVTHCHGSSQPLSVEIFLKEIANIRNVCVLE